MTVNELVWMYKNSTTISKERAEELTEIMSFTPTYLLEQMVYSIGKVPFLNSFAFKELNKRSN
jgi:hypothetical protein